ncbi:2-dehydro-3-deoxygalactonokinase [Tritonibacter horizontis]|uniref:Putative 2-dehydro-3-deoxygalactonokinase DgoK1 n=1 Tax=Tritonibacter horizontis TaxID=1768241 RepID=A0A132C2S6_9RHOB|nr:2-dehydro-3-deoxygalactonokinase [Tritonibacter horizontis]KUP94891.1 putative 2-dehydro-3-deoxygalactonokinase DgoK1 [Tritonibacter horizontis]
MTQEPHSTPSWIAVDWGTSHLRIWPMDDDDRPLCRIDSDKGMGVLAPTAYEETLLTLLEPYIQGREQLEVICCGMAGSRQGWVEAPYLVAPCAPPSVDTATRVVTADKRLDVRILSGVMQHAPADVMRGEETQIAGVLAAEPEMDGVICLPGTHTKWVSVRAGQITHFATFLTGELFQLVSKQSVLRHSVATEGWDQGAFEAGCHAAIKSPHGIANALFRLRAEALLSDLDPIIARSRASGYLLGLEIEDMRRNWQDKTVVIVGENEIARAYAVALQSQGAETIVADAEEITLAGLRTARAPKT